MGLPAVDLNSVPERLSELVEQASLMGEVVLARDGKAVAKIIPLRSSRGPRKPGSARGMIHMVDDSGDSLMTSTSTDR